ncbi:MAG: hypothetical protein LUC93_16605 [Planctomycetaceae bacterium]|nr:hypothetical protein [Planctomycetaceae bacterium]
MADFNQDEIDKLLAGDLGGDDDAAATPPPQPMAELTGAASQDDIDALFAAAGVEDAAEPAPAEPEPAPAPEETTGGSDLEGVANQDDIDALFAAVGASDEPAPEAETIENGVASQDDIDALFGAAEAAAPQPEAVPEEPEPEPDPDSEMVEPDPVEEALDAAEAAQAASAAQDDTLPEADDLDELLSSIEQEAAAAPMANADDAEPADAGMDPDEAESEQPDVSETSVADDIDMEELLRQVAEAAPPPPPPKPKPDTKILPEATVVLSPHASLELAQAQAAAVPPPPEPPSVIASVPPPHSHAIPQPSAADIANAAGARREFSVLYGAGEVESVANQISALLNAMSEKAHGYMQAWIAADSEAKELRSRALAEERRRSGLQAEKEALTAQVDDLRMRLGEVEGGKVASEESLRTLETTYQAKIRELESRVKLLGAESEALKDELTRARNQATGVDIESRRVRFEVDRLKNEVESERMERLRIQRALENREKEIQAMQSQAQGQASSLFIDELHRLVRRLESELEARTSGAHEALKQVDRLEVGEDQVPVLANLRASLMSALGQEDSDDALKSLGRDASGVKGPNAVAPQKAEIVSFETALSTYNLVQAVDVASALLREASATAGSLMRKIYQNQALRRPEVADHLVDLARLLEGLRTIQESTDRSRGMESGESEVFYVHMFDFLHNLVRLKLINRLSGDIWRLFLDLRGRFSFVTSDKQWAEYRDKTLNTNK